MIRLILILLLSKNFNRSLKSLSVCTWTEMQLQGAKAISFSLFTAQPDWIYKAFDKDPSQNTVDGTEKNRLGE